MAKIAIADKISLKLDLDMNDNICKNLKYPTDTIIVDQPLGAKYFSRELEDDDTFVWAGFVKPGRHSFIINDPISPNYYEQPPYSKQFLVGPRKKDLMECMTGIVQDISVI